MAKLEYRNLVRLLGFSLEGAERLLVYEFVQNGSLDGFIFGNLCFYFHQAIMFFFHTYYMLVVVTFTYSLILLIYMHVDPIKRVLIDWNQRYKIVKDIAKGLLYMHDDSGFRIIHRDLKAGNILFIRQGYES